MNLTEWQRAAMRPGMVHFPTEENRDAKRYCAGCASGDPVRATGKGDTRNRVRCLKLAKARQGQGLKGAPEVIEAGAPGCKYWEARK